MGKLLSERMRLEANNPYLDDELLLGFADEVEQMERELKDLREENKALRANASKSVLRRLDVQLEDKDENS